MWRIYIAHVSGGSKMIGILVVTLGFDGGSGGGFRSHGGLNSATFFAQKKYDYGAETKVARIFEFIYLKIQFF